MPRRTSSIATPLAHLVGPGKLKVINQQLAFVTDKSSPLRLDPESLENVFCYGKVGITDQAFQILFQHEVEVSWMTPAGNKCKGRLVRADRSTTALRILQHQVLSQPEHQLKLAANVVTKKIESQIEAARHYQRHGQAQARPLLQQLGQARTACDRAQSLDQLRGLEGSASATWFGFFGQLLKAPWQFTQRLRRPPPDPVNALLSLGYTWLLNKTIARVEAMGLEVYLGALHAFRSGRPSLACDLMEPLRVPAVDRWLVPLLNRQTIKPEDFVKEKEGYHLKEGIFPRMLHEWETHWQSLAAEEVLQHLINDWVAYFRQRGALNEEADSD